MSPVRAESPATDAVRDAAARLPAAGADPVALGRPFLANPDLVARLRLDAPLNPVRGRYLDYVGGATGYTDHPALPEVTAQPSSSSSDALDGSRVA